MFSHEHGKTLLENQTCELNTPYQSITPFIQYYKEKGKKGAQD